MKTKTPPIFLQVRDLLIQFQTKQKKHNAVKGVSFDVYKGEIFSIVGESGSGKTTIARAIAGVQAIKDGTIYMNDKILRGTPPSLYKINQAINHKLTMLDHNNSWVNKNLTNYIDNLKITYYKYFVNKKYHPITKILKPYHNKNFIITSDTDVQQSKILNFNKSKKYFNICQDTYQENISLLKDITKKYQRISTFLFNLNHNIANFPLQLETEILNRNKGLLDLTQSNILLANKIYKLFLALAEQRKNLSNNLTLVNVKKFYQETVVKLQTILQYHKQFVANITNINNHQQEAFILFVPLKERNKYLAHYEYKNGVSKGSTLAKSFLALLELEAIDKIVQEAPMFQVPKARVIKQQKQKIQMIFQDPYSSLNDRIAISEVIGEGLNSFKALYQNDEARTLFLTNYNANLVANERPLTLAEVNDKDVKAFLIAKMVQEVGLLPEHLSRYAYEFSGGQKQRIGIARALIMNPELVIADEPISALDVSIRAQILNLLRKFQMLKKLTYLFIAHDLSIVRHISDRIAVMYNGQIVELAPAAELFANPLHPYTKALLSAIPQPNPISEKKRIPFTYQPEREHYDYAYDLPAFVEVKAKHYLYANTRELKAITMLLSEDKEKQAPKNIINITINTKSNPINIPEQTIEPNKESEQYV